MNKLDNIFIRVISDADFIREYNVQTDLYSTITDGFNATNPYVRAVAWLLIEVDKQVAEMEREQRTRNVEGKVELPESFKQKMYRYLVKELSNEFMDSSEL